MTMTTVELGIRIMICRIEDKLWDSAASDILAPNGDIIGSSVTGHKVNGETHISYTLTDSARSVPINPSFTLMMMDDESLAAFIKVVFKKDDMSPIHECDIVSVNINGTDMSLGEIPYRDTRKIENMILDLCAQL